jgi:hypothetical protein
MQTGRVHCASAVQQDTAEQTLCILASILQQATRDATLYVVEAQRTVILPRDIELALKRLVLPGSAYWKRTDLSEEAQQLRTRLFASGDCSSESDEDWVTDIDDVWTQTARSPLTREMNAAPARFADWEPDIPFMKSLKQAVQCAMTRM